VTRVDPDVEEEPLLELAPELDIDPPSRGTRLMWRFRDRAHEEPALVVLILAILVWVLVFGRLVVLRHDRFRTIDFDLGIHDQSIWLLAHLESFDTVRGLPVFGHHATFAYYFLVPLLWLGGNPNTWNVLQVIALASSALPIYFVAKRKLDNTWFALGLGLAWLLQPPVQFFAWETFHPEVMAIPFLLWAYWAAESRRRWTYVVFIVLALLWKEDISLFVVGFGAMYVFRRRNRLALGTMTLGAVWFLVFGVWFVPHVAGGKTVYGGLYGSLGETPGQVARTALTHPGEVVDRLRKNDAPSYARDLVTPYGFIPLAAPEALLSGLPQVAVNALSTADFTWSLHYHYQALPLTSLGIASVEAVDRLRRWRRWRRNGPPVAVGAITAAALVATMTIGISPIGEEYNKGFWPLSVPFDLSARNEAMRMIGSSDGVAADYFAVPHLTHRAIVYTFPNPWRNKNYGTSPAARGDPAKVKWLFLNTADLPPGDIDRALYQAIRDSGEFVTRLDRDGVVLLERVKPPGGTIIG
jgi:uncharacterized membrane protein